ncbi:alpha/beta fold hydrolase [Falsirhodobacter sp. 20TX0035]|uniref:alpha/beta fold hydrolase n=1 Tax=Falsirhodobacter sp. 20TX0035 TaxID=3022019 RepID=UPI00232C7B6A|nr:alpha/beta fold hydrolase [Falsirhodobacter sp. 20TX0035]MDB6453380.1 alpha/beta fold hydrolase [Falsirhodobacter sp. 20TX0035]
MPLLPLSDRAIQYDTRGEGAPVVLAHPLGFSSAIWEGITLPDHLRVASYDLRGAPMGALVRDAEALMDALGLRDAVFVGAGLGGLVAQGLAVKRMDLVRGLVLMNTAARVPATSAWRAAQTTATDMAPLIEPIIARSFAPAARRSAPADRARAMLSSCDPAVYAAGAAAIEGTDFYTTTATLTLPTLVMTGADDAITPPDLARETADLIVGSEFRLLRGSGHYPALDAPLPLSEALSAFLARIGH